MTSRQRFRETMRFGKPDRVPYFEEGIREDVIKSWYKQGLSQETSVSDLFDNDPSYEIDLAFNPLSFLHNRPISLKELSILRNQLTSEKISQTSQKWLNNLYLSEKKDHVLFLKVHNGFFLSMGVENWSKFSDLMSLLINDPQFVQGAMSIQGELIAKYLDLALQNIEVDAIIFGEPIGGNEGPLISPGMFEKFVLRSYKPILDIIKKHDIETIIMRTYANARILVPSILNIGFNCLWACETNCAAMDYLDIRKEFGRDLRLIGGIDLDALRHGKEAIHKEIEGKVPILIEGGGYVPIADGRVRTDISFENYTYYRKLLELIIRNKN